MPGAARERLHRLRRRPAHDIDAAQDGHRPGHRPGLRIRACGHHIGTTGDMNNRPPWWKAYETPGVDIAADGPTNCASSCARRSRAGGDDQDLRQLGHGAPNRTTRNMSRTEIATIVETAHERARGPAYVARSGDDPRVHRARRRRHRPRRRDRRRGHRQDGRGGHVLGAEPRLPWSLLEVGYAKRFGVSPQLYEHAAMLPERSGPASASSSVTTTAGVPHAARR